MDGVGEQVWDVDGAAYKGKSRGCLYEKLDDVYCRSGAAIGSSLKRNEAGLEGVWMCSDLIGKGLAQTFHDETATHLHTLQSPAGVFCGIE